ncbi:MAG TPA: cyclic nucleotide-binding domain-containing protein [Usitatibacteraceae bacterium]|nr:cyclic nucleotide-binding domain-containing protein [Usitatibacteraceae bacterium]
MSRPVSAPDTDAQSTVLPFRRGTGLYDPAIARQFFKTFGRKETIAAATVLFRENERSRRQNIFQKPLTKALLTRIDRDLFRKRNIHRMFLLTRGEVTLKSGQRLLDRVRPGDLFGEMAVISEIPELEIEAPRSATAKAVEDCALYSLDGEETLRGLAKQPEFALMLMSAMFERLRLLAARLGSRSGDSSHRSLRSVPVFEAAALASLVDEFDRAAVVRFPGGARIIRQGNSGTSMYVVLEGTVAVAIGRRIVEKLGPGGVFGEMALVDQAPRSASVVARTDSVLLAINRPDLVRLVQSRPQTGMAMMRAVAARLRYMNSLFA